MILKSLLGLVVNIAYVFFFLKVLKHMAKETEELLKKDPQSKGKYSRAFSVFLVLVFILGLYFINQYFVPVSPK